MSSNAPSTPNNQGSDLLKETLLAEYQRQLQTEASSSVIETVNSSQVFNEERARRMEVLQQSVNRERYIDIVNVHAAASAQHNYNGLNESYRSQDDEKSRSRIMNNRSYTQEDLIDAYGLGDRLGSGVYAENYDKDDDNFTEPTNRETYSEMDFYEREVRRKNFISLFLNKNETDEYIVTHLYGVLQDLDLDNTSQDEIDNIFNTSAQNLSCTFDQRAHVAKKSVQNIRKLSSREVFVALLKGYCGTAILLLPRTFQNGGIGITPIFISMSALVSTVCIGKLVDAGLAYNLFSYSLVVEKAFGKKGRLVLDVMVSLTQFSFTLPGIIFIMNTFKNTFDVLFDLDSNLWVYGLIIFCIYTPISWVRNIAKFSVTYLLGNLLILLAVLFVSVYCGMTINRQDGIGEGIKFINENEYLGAVGMSIYCFEGIGIVMPIMHASENPQTFKRELIKVIVFLTVIYIIFGAFGYLTWGETTIESFATEMLPPDNMAVIAMKFLYSINLILTYSITIQPANKIYGDWFCSWAARGNCSYWLKNLQRTVCVLIAVVISLTIANKLDKFLGLIGALLCAPLAMTIPALVHLRLLAKTTKEKLIDISLIVASTVVLSFCTVQSVANW